jgi:hypothetical protein
MSTREKRVYGVALLTKTFGYPFAELSIVL